MPRDFRRSLVLLARAARAAALAGVGATAILGLLSAPAAGQPSRPQRAGPTEGRAPEAARLARPQSFGRLHIVEPRLGQQVQPGELRLRVAAPAEGGRTAEVLAAWNSDPSGATPIVSCRVPLDQLVAGVRAPPQMTHGRLGSFTLQARVVEPDERPFSAPVDIRIATAPSPEAPGHLATPARGEGILPRPAAAPPGSFVCSG